MGEETCLENQNWKAPWDDVNSCSGRVGEGSGWWAETERQQPSFPYHQSVYRCPCGHFPRSQAHSTDQGPLGTWRWTAVILSLQGWAGSICLSALLCTEKDDKMQESTGGRSLHTLDFRTESWKWTRSTGSTGRWKAGVPDSQQGPQDSIWPKGEARRCNTVSQSTLLVARENETYSNRFLG